MVGVADGACHDDSLGLSILQCDLCNMLAGLQSIHTDAAAVIGIIQQQLQIVALDQLGKTGEIDLVILAQVRNGGQHRGHNRDNGNTAAPGLDHVLHVFHHLVRAEVCGHGQNLNAVGLDVGLQRLLTIVDGPNARAQVGKSDAVGFKAAVRAIIRRRAHLRRTRGLGIAGRTFRRAIVLFAAGSNRQQHGQAQANQQDASQCFHWVYLPFQ